MRPGHDPAGARLVAEAYDPECPTKRHPRLTGSGTDSFSLTCGNDLQEHRETARHGRRVTVVTIDSQVHIYEANTPRRPWRSVPDWADHVTGDDLVAAMDR